jgi:hypothetical protein
MSQTNNGGVLIGSVTTQVVRIEFAIDGVTIVQGLEELSGVVDSE